MLTYTRMCIKAMKTFSEQSVLRALLPSITWWPTYTMQSCETIFLHDWKYNINLLLGRRMHSRQPQSQTAQWHCLTLMRWTSKHLWIWMDLFLADILFLRSFTRILSDSLLHPLYRYMLFNIKYLIVVIKNVVNQAGLSVVPMRNCVLHVIKEVYYSWIQQNSCQMVPKLQNRSGHQAVHIQLWIFWFRWFNVSNMDIWFKRPRWSAFECFW